MGVVNQLSSQPASWPEQQLVDCPNLKRATAELGERQNWLEALAVKMADTFFIPKADAVVQQMWFHKGVPEAEVQTNHVHQASGSTRMPHDARVSDGHKCSSSLNVLNI